MAATIPVETESGTYSGRVHPHNGYYAGDFGSRRAGRNAQASGAAESPSHRSAVAC